MQEIGKFRGEPVYPRSNVQQLRSAETWLREGRTIKVGEQPLKRVAQRAHTINAKRALELAKADTLIDMPTQGLYAKWQTELYVAEPVVEVNGYRGFSILYSNAQNIRGKFQRMSLATSTCLCRVCYRQEEYILNV
jgi:hypothetical protein